MLRQDLLLASQVHSVANYRGVQSSAASPELQVWAHPQTAQHWQCGLLRRNWGATTIPLTSMLLLNPWLRFPFTAIELCWNAHRGNIIAALAFQPRISHATE